ncbi:MULTISPECIES: protealysin inhibitor emfourin [Halomonadaceae]|uniref:protealysin inhibitor emfourin n=1 Tax=Halomonadaceae TaxID=28256 RepID=UPI00159B120C|nr:MULTISPECIES: protealysin inhibitor emfourin [Halomonas]QJQ95256.1 hypothetical protein HIO72_08215 [Halomonas sp. PA5]
MTQVPRLTRASRLSLSREGGVAHFPGLAKARHIVCAECSEEQRRWLQRLLEEAARDVSHVPGNAPDQRIFRLQVDESGAAEAAGGECWSIEINETAAPPGLVVLWRRGEMPGDGACSASPGLDKPLSD